MKQLFILTVCFLPIIPALLAQEPYLPKGERESSTLTSPFFSPLWPLPNQLKMRQGSQKLDSIQVYWATSESGMYKKKHLVAYDYNSLGQCISYLSIYLSDEQTAIPSVKWEYGYDDEGYHSESVGYYWNQDEGFYPVAKRTLNYDSSGNLLEKIKLFWDEDAITWYPYSKDSFAYNSEGQRVAKYDVSWNDVLQKWGTALLREEYLYDTEGKLIQQDIYTIWPLSYPNKKIEYTYNAKGLEAESILYDYIANPLYMWLPERKTESTYDPHGNLTNEFTSFWQEENALWRLSMQTVRQYNTAYTTGDLWLPLFWDKSEHMLVEQEFLNWDTLNLSWQPNAKWLIFYSDTHLSGSNSSEDNILTAYPNPVFSEAYFSFPPGEHQLLLEVFDVQGRLLLTLQAQPAIPVSLSQLLPGMYFFTLSNSEKQWVGKFVKQ